MKLTISLHNIRFMFFFFIPKHLIDRHSVNLHARVVILKLQSGLWLTQAGYMRHKSVCDVSNRAINEQACNKRFMRNDCIP